MEFEDMVTKMLLDPPDRDEPLPLSNRRATILGITIAFLILSCIAVGMRLYVRFRVVREPGWDDFFVVLAAATNAVGKIFVYRSIHYGLGQHLLFLGLHNMSDYLFSFYIFHAFYVSQTALIKISLLLQYLRIFKAGLMRYVCLGLLVTIVIWGLAYGFMAWIPCFPVPAFWARQRYPGARCYGFGFADIPGFVLTFESHSGTNMVFDFLVFFTPMVLFSKPDLKMKSLVAMVGVFLLGATVVLTSVWRLYTIVEHRAGTDPYIDFTWWTPISIILSCLEIDLAVMCASIPIFWPVLERSFLSLSTIFVTHEVHITEQPRFDPHSLTYELENKKRGRSGSIKSTSGHSRESLTRENRWDIMDGHYKDQYVLEAVEPFNRTENHRMQTDIESEPQPKWNI